MIRLVAAVGALALAGCTSVRMVQREGCWVRRTETWPGRVVEELGPCTAPSPPWSDDRVSRAVQECVTRADHRWQMQAQLAWSRGEPLPAPGADDAVYQACMEEPAKALAGDVELLRARNADVQQRLADVARERDQLRARAEEERGRRDAALGERLAAQEKLSDRLLSGQERTGDRLLHGQDALAAYLGEAAKKASQPAVATATATSRSDGSASAERPAAGSRPAALPSRRAAVCRATDAGARAAGKLAGCAPEPAAAPAEARPEQAAAAVPAEPVSSPDPPGGTGAAPAP